MMWALLIVLSARTGFGLNTEGGVASQVIEFQSESMCREAARQVLQVNGSQGFFVSATCVQRSR